MALSMKDDQLSMIYWMSTIVGLLNPSDVDLTNEKYHY